MAYDERLAERIRVALAEHREVTERKMFGGIAFMVGGSMCCGVVRDDLMVRVGPEAYESALGEAHARPMDFTGRPMRGMVYVGSAGLRTKTSLGRWVERGSAYAESAAGKRKASRKRGR